MIVCIAGIAPVTDGIATVAISNLQCGVTYNITAEGMSNEILLAPRSSHGNVSVGPCPSKCAYCQHNVCRSAQPNVLDWNEPLKVPSFE